MRLSCPNCSTDYDVPEAALAGRSRDIRCARCGHQWRHEMPAAAVSPAGEVANVTPAPADAVPATLPDAPPPIAAPLTSAPPAPPPIAEPEVTAADQPELRTFGQSVDEDARAAIEAAAMTEGGPPLHIAAAEDNTVAGDPLPGDDLAVTPPMASQDRFAELFRSAQDRAANYEPEPVTPPAVRTSSTPLVVILLILFVLGMIFIERRAVMHAFPASAQLFQALGVS